MNRTQWIALVAMVVLGVLVAVLMSRNRQPTPMPPDRDHIWLGTDACLACHGPQGGLPRTPNHPVGRDCLRCHANQP